MHMASSARTPTQNRSRSRLVRLSVELRRLGARALELPEVWIGRERLRRVPQLAGFFATRDLREHRAEECDAVDVDGRRADIVAYCVHAFVVALAQRLVVLVGGGR